MHPQRRYVSIHLLVIISAFGIPGLSKINHVYQLIAGTPAKLAAARGRWPATRQQS